MLTHHLKDIKQVLDLLSLLEEWYGLIGMGYKKRYTMLNVNSGTQRRFQATLELNSYTTESAIEIIKSGMKSSNAAPSRSNLIILKYTILCSTILSNGY